MFVIDLHYVGSLAQIDEAMPAHMKFLATHYHNKTFLMSGRKVPRTGGIIIASASSKEAIEEIMNQDPFVVKKLATYTLTEFRTSQTLPELKIFRD